MTLKSIVALLPGRRRRRKYEEQVEQATAAPGELRPVHIPDEDDDPDDDGEA